MGRERGVKNIFAPLEVKKEICFMFVRSTGYVIFSASVVSALKKLEFQLAFWRRSSQIVLALGKSSFFVSF